MSTAFYPQTDGQTEGLNTVLQQYLCCYVSNKQDDWTNWLPIAELATNNQVSAAPKATPFYTNYGYHPWGNNAIAPTNKSPQAMDSHQFPQRFTKISKFLRTYMRTAQERYETSTNQLRSPTPSFLIGDQVFLSTKNIRTTRQSRRLD